MRGWAVDRSHHLLSIRLGEWWERWTTPTTRSVLGGSLIQAHRAILGGGWSRETGGGPRGRNRETLLLGDGCSSMQIVWGCLCDGWGTWERMPWRKGGDLPGRSGISPLQDRCTDEENEGRSWGSMEEKKRDAQRKGPDRTREDRAGTTRGGHPWTFVEEDRRVLSQSSSAARVA